MTFFFFFLFWDVHSTEVEGEAGGERALDNQMAQFHPYVEDYADVKRSLSNPHTPLCGRHVAQFDFDIKSNKNPQ